MSPRQSFWNALLTSNQGVTPRLAFLFLKAGMLVRHQTINTAVVANDPCESDRIWQPELRGNERRGVCKVS